MSFLSTVADHWLWLIVAGLLAIAEMIAPGVFLIWIGAAAALTGLLAWALPIGWVAQVLIFAAASVAAIYAGRSYLARNPIESTDPLLNDRGARLIGQVVIAVEPVDAVQGRVKVGDSVWSARGAEAQAGDRLRVTGCDSGILSVERL